MAAMIWDSWLCREPSRARAAGVRRIGFRSTSPPSKRQEPQEAVGREAEAVAGFAEGVAHGADEAEAALGVGEGPDLCGPDADFGGAIHRSERAVNGFDGGAHLGFGDHGLLGIVSETGPAEGHEFDETHSEGQGPDKSGEVGDFIFVHSLHHNDVNFDPIEAESEGRIDRLPNFGQIAAAGDVGEAFGFEGIE